MIPIFRWKSFQRVDTIFYKFIIIKASFIFFLRKSLSIEAQFPFNEMQISSIKVPFWKRMNISLSPLSRKDIVMSRPRVSSVQRHELIGSWCHCMWCHWNGFGSDILEVGWNVCEARPKGLCLRKGLFQANAIIFLLCKKLIFFSTGNWDCIFGEEVFYPGNICFRFSETIVSLARILVFLGFVSNETDRGTPSRTVPSLA